MQPDRNGKQRTFEHARSLISKEAPRPGSLLVFPEMFATGFLTRPSQELAENVSPEFPTFRFLQDLAKETQCTVLGGGIENFSQIDFRFRNWTAAFAATGENPLAIYRKSHPFADEAALFAPGTETVSFFWDGFCAFPFICFDLRFPEDFRKARKAGASLFIVQAEWPQSRDTHFKTLLRARAIENQCFVLACARAGSAFASSCAFDPNGNELLVANHEEKIFSVELSANDVLCARQAFPLPLPEI